uniref:Zinc finger, CCHC-type n=1 Tax=Tanacetum cinerariifolium TaxID=118510 RepID=A0A699H2M9_TANCI|nr:zinc finger, CCHC-type [Tanacetum cinerariifolium]
MGLLGFWVVDVYKVRMNRGFLSLKYKRGRGVKEKEGKSIGGSDLISGEDISYNVAKNTNGYPLLVFSSLGDHTVEKMTQSGNNKGTHNENMGQTPISSTVDPKLELLVNGLLIWHMVSFSESGWLTLLLLTMFETLGADVELKYTIVVATPKLVLKGFYTFTIRVEYEWKPPRCACSKVFGRVQDECPKNIGLNVAENLKKHSQAPRGVSVGPKMGFKLVKQVYRHVSKRIMPILVVIRRKMQSLEKSKEANSSGYSFWNARSSSSTTTPVVEKIDGKLTLVDDEGKPLEKFYYSGDHNSEDEVEQVDNEMTNFLASKRVGYAAGKEAEWLKNLLFEILFWSKPIAPISIRCDSVVTLAKAYSQMYIGKSRHLGVRHRMIRELIVGI